MIFEKPFNKNEKILSSNICNSQTSSNTGKENDEEEGKVTHT